MRINQTFNGNVEIIKCHENISNANISNENWQISNVDTQSDSINRLCTSQYNINSNYDKVPTSGFFKYVQKSQFTLDENTNEINRKEVCNRQYRLNTGCNINTTNFNDNKTSSSDNTTVTSTNIFIEETNAYNTSFKIFSEEEKALDHSGTDEMSENVVRTLPRGIVNPNYPGFQHLAHTLQDYSCNIENFYYSENDMTDDDVDVEITELTYECENQQNVSREINNINNNNNFNDPNIEPSECDSIQTAVFVSKPKVLDRHVKNEVPDLIKTLSKNNNYIEVDNDFICSDADIETNFNTKDIIGDFNKEIEDEIKLLFNYNINIQDDIEVLKKDIKDTFAKPIENTINNISEVVNQVIKKLVETKNDTSSNETLDSDIDFDKDNIESDKMIKPELNQSRPTFLLIENKSNIIDAHLSDGKDEIKLYEHEYDTMKITNDVETTIKQLSTELRKIIPKLDEMRERDMLWGTAVLTDDNSNQVGTSLQTAIINNQTVGHSGSTVSRNIENKTDVTAQKQGETISISERPKEKKVPRVSKSVTRRKSSAQKSRATERDLESFDVYNIETALPKLDLDAIENHLKAAKEAERRKRNDREEIRRRLAMGADSDEFYSMGHTERPGKKPSLHSRLQNGAKLRPTSLSMKSKSRSSHSLGHIELKESDFYALQSTLQTEARIALAQAKEMARIQMERERRSRAVSPVTEMLRRSMEKANVPLAADRRRVSRQLLTDMNIAQLQVIVNELHSQIESLNESLVTLLMARDELHMGQDSMLVDIEDLTRYLGVKEQTKKNKGSSAKSGVRRLTSLVHK